ncbi:hypothetical protein [Peribacillus kribbensis]|nr:hypothetical protein [Peribacillus kribbensis]
MSSKNTPQSSRDIEYSIWDTSVDHREYQKADQLKKNADRTKNGFKS